MTKKAIAAIKRLEKMSKKTFGANATKSGGVISYSFCLLRMNEMNEMHGIMDDYKDTTFDKAMIERTYVDGCYEVQRLYYDDVKIKAKDNELIKIGESYFDAKAIYSIYEIVGVTTYASETSKSGSIDCYFDIDDTLFINENLHTIMIEGKNGTGMLLPVRKEYRA